MQLSGCQERSPTRQSPTASGRDEEEVEFSRAQTSGAMGEKRHSLGPNLGELATRSLGTACAIFGNQQWKQPPGFSSGGRKQKHPNRRTSGMRRGQQKGQKKSHDDGVLYTPFCCFLHSSSVSSGRTKQQCGSGGWEAKLLREEPWPTAESC